MNNQSFISLCISVLILLLFNEIKLLHCLEQLYRAYIPKSSIKWFNQIIIQETDFDLWLSTRVINREKLFKSNDTSFNHTLFENFAEFRVKNEETMSKYMIEFNKHEIQLKLLSQDLYKHTHSRQRRSLLNSTIAPDKIVGKYATYESIINWMKHLRKSHPNLVKLRQIGETVGKSKLVVLELSTANSVKWNKRAVFFESGIHAREWISIATSIYTIDKLIKEYLSNDPGAVNILNQFDLHFLVMANPDGYRFSYSSPDNRLWRKNVGAVKSYGKNGCFGVDLNRNFDFKWMSSGSSSNPCSEIHAGTHPSSENEVTILKKYLLSKFQKWSIYFGLHSYGHLWLTPYSYSVKHIVENFMESCSKAMRSIKKMENEFDDTFTFGGAAHVLYEASGSSEDWTKHTAQIPFTYVIELKPTAYEEEIGFIFPENKIKKSSKEIYFGLKDYLVSFYNNTYEQKITNLCANEMKTMKRLHGQGHRDVPES